MNLQSIVTWTSGITSTPRRLGLKPRYHRHRRRCDGLPPIDVAVVRIKVKEDWFGAAGLQGVGPDGLCHGRTGAGLGIVDLLVAQ